MKPSLELKGGRELENNLLAMQGATAKKVVLTALVKVLQRVATSAKAKVARRTGTLANSIGVGTKLTRRQNRLKQPIANAEAYVGPGIVGKGGRRAVAHSHLVEFGTENMAPRPYMTPAWEGEKQRVFNDLGAAMWNEITKRIKKATGRGS